jgi:glycogen(starch) synthase
LVKDKGFDVALDAFARVMNCRSDARMRIVGDGPARRELETRAADLGIEDAVSFPGRVPPGVVAREINASTVVVMPSRNSEGFGLVALEASQMGRPVIASRLGGLPEVVVDGQTGLLIEPDDVTALSDAILRLLGEPEVAIGFGHAGRKHARSFSIERYTDEYDSLYRKLIEETQVDV